MNRELTRALLNGRLGLTGIRFFRKAAMAYASTNIFFLAHDAGQARRP